MNIILIFLGGGLGSVLRYLTNIFIRSFAGQDFPFGTLLINVTGSLLIGVAYALFKKAELTSDNIPALVMVGVLGGFTTFSAFSLEVMVMVNDGKVLPAAIYVLASVVLSITATFLGLALFR